jgi:hypothetical protein
MILILIPLTNAIIFWRKLQSVINDGRLTLGDGGKMKLDTDPIPISMVELMDKKVLVCRDDQGQERGHFR